MARTRETVHEVDTAERAGVANSQQADEGLDLGGQTMGPSTGTAPESNTKIGFFEALASYTQSEWEGLMVYLYRLAPVTDRLAGGNSVKFIQKYVEPFDEERLKHDHGSGRYRLILNKLVGATKRSKPVRQVEIDIEDPKFPPNIPEGEWLEDPRNKRWAWARKKADAPAATITPNGTISPIDLLNLVEAHVKKMMPAAPQDTQAQTTRAVLDAIKDTRQELSAATDPTKILAFVREMIDLQSSKSQGSSEVIQILKSMQEASDRRAEAAEKRAADAQARNDALMLKMMEGNKEGGGLKESLAVMSTVMDFAGRMRDQGSSLSGWKGVLTETAEYIPAALGHVEGIVKTVVGAAARRNPEAATPTAPAPPIVQTQAVEVKTEDQVSQLSPGAQQFARFVPIFAGQIQMAMARQEHGYDFADTLISTYGRNVYDQIHGIGKADILALLQSNATIWQQLAPTDAAAGRLGMFIDQFLAYPEGLPPELEEAEEEEPKPKRKTKQKE